MLLAVEAAGTGAVVPGPILVPCQHVHQQVGVAETRLPPLGPGGAHREEQLSLEGTAVQRSAVTLILTDTACSAPGGIDYALPPHTLVAGAALLILIARHINSSAW